MIRYRCDRCNREGTSKEHERVWLPLRMGYGHNEKAFDLCMVCKKVLEEWLSRGHQLPLDS